jgi:hypothetical protein
LGRYPGPAVHHLTSLDFGKALNTLDRRDLEAVFTRPLVYWLYASSFIIEVRRTDYTDRCQEVER